jgi:hypothetical protein
MISSVPEPRRLEDFVNKYPLTMKAIVERGIMRYGFSESRAEK